MIEKHALWSGLASGRGYNLDTEAKREAFATWNIVAICERFGWTPDYVLSMSQSFMEELITICNLREKESSKSQR